MKRLGLLAVLLVLASGAAASGTQGATAFDSLSLDAAPRAAAMGGAYAAAGDDADAMLYNPAALAFLSASQVSMAHADLDNGLTQDYLGLALQGEADERLEGGGRLLPAGHGAGVFVETFDFGRLQRTTLSNTGGSGLGTFGVRDWAAGASYALRAREWLGVGATVKYLRENIDRTVAQTEAVDVGARAALEKAVGTPVFLGAALQNLGPDPRFGVLRQPLPTTLRLGFAWQPTPEYEVSMDGVEVRGGGFSTRLGGEWYAAKSVALRLGWNGQNDAGPGVTAGVGIVLKAVRVDYAFVPYGDAGNAHRIGATVRW
ncbi:MAG: PorV/PorQ family protein [Elusimicrobia bacterium]|nr:PorV/PorQ family protein [Elusimicrobiota bacterium]